MSDIFRLQCAIWHDSLDHRDACVINPVFKVVGVGGSNPQQLCDDLAAAIKVDMGASMQIRVRAYDVAGTRPNYHVGEAILNKGLVANSTVPRELAVCLSFYSGVNAPRRRGRLYLPVHWLHLSVGANRPSTPMMNNALSWKDRFTALGGINVDWVVYSERDQTSRPVTDCYVDDEYDVIRSRGLKPSARVTAHPGEDAVPNRVPLVAASSGDAE